MQKSRLSTGNLTSENLNLGLKTTILDRMHIKTLTALASDTSFDVLTESAEEIIYVNPRFSPDRSVPC